MAAYRAFFIWFAISRYFDTYLQISIIAMLTKIIQWKSSVKKIVFAVACALTLAGCVTSAVRPSMAKLTPPERVFAYQTNIPNESKLTVVRDSGFLGGCYYGFYINGERAASIDVGEKVEFHLISGELTLGFKGEGSICIANVLQTERQIVLKPGEHKAVQLFADSDGYLDLKLITLN